MLKGKKINLRLVKESDIEVLHQLNQNLENRGGFLPLDLRSEITMRSRFQEDGMWSESKGTMVIVDPSTDRQIGTFVYFRGVSYMDGYEVGYALFDPADRGKGYGSEALEIGTRYLFMTFNIERLQLAVHPDNVASMRVAEKCGYVREGLLRGFAFNRGKHEDLVLFSLLRSDVALN